ncbi:MAG: TRC40/GET3/ArsA family transport-energizing ATPase [Solirubrobacterales bacterium]|nr:TRC40/GET3/ArsA family transport-energizing ATPase [Solirubrobacterales bacterium]
MPPRTILYTGKGGVGKTSVAAATARRCAALGRRTVIVSTDPAHSLADAVGTELGPDPVGIDRNLWGQEVIAETEMRRHWDRVGTWMAGLLLNQGVDRIRAEELTVPPGLGELFSLLQIKRHWEEGEFDVVIVDCAPSGETLRLLGYPEIAGWWMRRLFPGNRKLLGAAAPLAKALDVPLPEPELVDEVELLLDNLVTMDAILRDHRHCSIRLVMNPDRMVIDEARRTFAHLGLFGYLTDAVIVNRLFPPEVEGTYFESWRSRQTEHLNVVEEGFAPVPVLTSRFFEQEVVGTGMHELLADELHGDRDPGEILHRGLAREITTGRNGTRIRISAPFTEKEEIRVQQHGDELIVSAGELRRTIILPSGLARRSPDQARFEDGVLEITFSQENDPEPQTVPE